MRWNSTQSWYTVLDMATPFWQYLMCGHNYDLWPCELTVVNIWCVVTTVTSDLVSSLWSVFKTHSTGTRACFFCQRVVNPWNNLPTNIDFSSLSAFKRFISNIDFSNYLKRYWFLSCLFRFYWLYCDFTVFVHFFIALLLFNYRMSCRGAIRALGLATPVILSVTNVHLWCYVFKQINLMIFDVWS